MIKLKNLFFSLCFFCALVNITNAQNWQGIDTTLPYAVRTLYTDTIANRLYIGGNIPNGVHYWNGSSRQYLGNISSYPVFAITRFQSDIYIGHASGLKKWNGATMNNAAIMSNSAAVFTFFEDNNLLYIGGVFDSIDGVLAKGLAVWNGTIWSPVHNFQNYTLPLNNSNYIYNITKYNGELYVGGNFEDSLNNVMNIARWDGAQWKDVGGSMHGGMDEVSRMVVYDNELYVAGTFTQAHGNAGNYIQKWNGSQWSDVGGGVIGIFGANGQIADMKVIHNKLYVVGVFDYAGGVSASKIASWDGTQWCGLGGTFNNNLGAIEKYNDTIYVGGGFDSIDSQFTGPVAKWTGGNYVDTCGSLTSIKEIDNQQSEILISPNPTTAQFTVTTTEKIKQIKIYSILGETIYQSTPHNSQTTIDLRESPNDIYFIQITTEKGITTRKLIKQGK